MITLSEPIAACTRARTLARPCPCATCIRLLHPGPTSGQVDVDPVQRVLVVLFPSSTSANTLLVLVIITCNLHWWYFFLAHLLMCTNT